MRALVYGGPWQLAVEDRPDPVPGPGEALLRVIATGICGSDLHGFTGENGRRVPGMVMGHESVGRVVGVGPDTPAPPGDVVTFNPVMSCGTCPTCTSGVSYRCPQRRIIGVTPEISAAFADLVVAPVANLVPLSPSVPPELGALIEPLAVGRHALGRAAVVDGMDVLIVGGGPIGQAVALAATTSAAGSVRVSEPTASRRDLLAALDLSAVDPTGSSAPADASADVVIDAVGSSGSISAALAACRPGGSVVLVGMHEPQLTLPAYLISVDERSVIGSFCYAHADLVEAAASVEADPNRYARLIEGRVPLDEAPAAFAALARGELAASKVLVEF
jgi:2-desacetyl-2-hydroxyethyl bacteriochlorophyllide A dehydrogenase